MKRLFPILTIVALLCRPVRQLTPRHRATHRGAGAGDQTTGGKPPAPTTAPTARRPNRSRRHRRIAIDSDRNAQTKLTTGYSVRDVGSKIFNGLVWLDGGYQPQPRSPSRGNL